MFSAEELEAARSGGYAEGYALAKREAEESEARRTAHILEAIRQDMKLLFEAENARARQYEREAVELALAVFKRLFPYYQAAHGFSELTASIEQVLRRQEGQNAITIYVAPDAVEPLQAKIPPFQGAGSLKIQGDAGIAAGSCRLAWAEGGAARDINALAGEIETLLKDLLAGKAAKVHD